MGATSLRGPVKGLLFDICDVLYDATVWRRWLLQLLTRLGLHANYRCFYRVWDRDYLPDVHRGRREFREAFESFLSAVGLSRPQIDEVEAACQARRRQLEAEARPLPGVRTTITRLHAAGLVLGTLSDSEYPAIVLSRQLEHFGLGGMFTAVLSSFDLGQTKPEPACYLRAIRAMNLSVEETAFVGHNAEELAGATAVGMQTIAFNFDPEARADVHIARFEELIELACPGRPYAAAG